jgi:hypothetical protein
MYIAFPIAEPNMSSSGLDKQNLVLHEGYPTYRKPFDFIPKMERRSLK